MQSVARVALSALRQQRAGGSSAAVNALFQRGWASNDSHDDFKPTSKAPQGVDTEALIKKWISENKVFVFMKGVPTAPQCGFSRLACAVLDAHGVKYGSANVLADNAIREGIKQFTGWPTIPQVFVEGEFVGGADIMMKMHESGELEKLLDPVIKAQAAAAK